MLSHIKEKHTNVSCGEPFCSFGKVKKSEFCSRRRVKKKFPKILVIYHNSVHVQEPTDGSTEDKAEITNLPSKMVKNILRVAKAVYKCCNSLTSESVPSPPLTTHVGHGLYLMFGPENFDREISPNQTM